MEGQRPSAVGGRQPRQQRTSMAAATSSGPQTPPARQRRAAPPPLSRTGLDLLEERASVAGPAARYMPTSAARERREAARRNTGSGAGAGEEDRVEEVDGGTRQRPAGGDGGG